MFAATGMNLNNSILMDYNGILLYRVRVLNHQQLLCMARCIVPTSTYIGGMGSIHIYE